MNYMRNTLSIFIALSMGGVGMQARESKSLQFGVIGSLNPTIARVLKNKYYLNLDRFDCSRWGFIAGHRG